MFLCQIQKGKATSEEELSSAGVLVRFTDPLILPRLGVKGALL